MSKYEFKGTPGGWRVLGREVGVKDMSDTQSYGMLDVICTVDQFDFAEHWQANAQAISAVPDLIEALRVADELISEKHYTEGATDQGKAAMEKIHAALAKATGATT